MGHSNGSDLFKKCPKCGFIWNTRESFLADPELEIIGYQANFIRLTSGLFYFNHICHGTLAIKAGVFEDLYAGPVVKSRATGSEECPGYCLHKDELEPCPANCECSYVREIIKIIKDYNNFPDCVTKSNSSASKVQNYHIGV